jgi:hypothetical protein
MTGGSCAVTMTPGLSGKQILASEWVAVVRAAFLRTQEVEEHLQ